MVHPGLQRGESHRLHLPPRRSVRKREHPRPHLASPKYDDLHPESAYKIFLVVFGGGVRRTEGVGVRVEERYFVGATLTSTKAYFLSTALRAGMGGLYKVTDGAVKKYYSIAGRPSTGSGPPLSAMKDMIATKQNALIKKPLVHLPQFLLRLVPGEPGQRALRG